jgi:hypothetical protein
MARVTRREMIIKQNIFFYRRLAVTSHKRDWQVKINVKEIDSLTNKVQSINLFGNQGMITIFLLRREILCTGMQGAVLKCTRVINDGIQTQVTTPSK